MNFLATSPQQLEQAGASATAREISQQPDLWRRLAPSMDAARAFLAPLLQRADVQVVLTGAGTSAHIGECLAPALARRWGTRVRAIATTDLVADPEGSVSSGAPLLLVSFARSGNSPESVAALELAERISPECHHLIVTCNAQGELCRRGEPMRRAHLVRLPDETNDRAFAMTSSFSGMMLAAALAFELLTPASAGRLADWAEQVLADFAAFVPPSSMAFDRVVYLGDREQRALAQEAALKLLELTDGRVVAVADTPLGFRHGPKTIIDEKTLVILFLCNHPYTRKYQLDLLKELRGDGIAYRVAALNAHEASPVATDILTVQDAADASELELCFPYAVFAQSMALQASLSRKLRPDAPNARGVVNRVVQGVTIHPWEPTP